MSSIAAACTRGLASLVMVVALAGFGPSGPGAKVTEEQLEYSKQLFGEGEAAMAEGNFTVALEKFKEGYRYAPHLHVFTFNIASAADALQDCRTAQTYFQMFVDLVPKHPQRGAAKKRLEELNEQCRHDPETETINTAPPEDGEVPGGGGSRESRAEREAKRIMNTAVIELVGAQRTYEAAKKRFPQQKEFARAARRKKRHAKRLRKVAAEVGVSIDATPPEVKLADTAKQACREAESQEKRIISAIEDMLEQFDSAKAYRVGTKILKAAERRDKQAFDACS